MPITATLWDFGGVILSSPFEAFATYERAHDLPEGFIRGLNATNSDDNAWARLERSEVDLDGFAELFEAEARAAGHEVDARAILTLLSGEIRPAMVEALRRCKGAGLRTAMLTNNFVVYPAAEPADEDDARMSAHVDRERQMAEIHALFDVVVESSRVRVRKPDPKFYELALDEVGVAADEAVFLDDLGVNLKPARAMGMTTIKVADPDAAIAELEGVLGIDLR